MKSRTVLIAGSVLLIAAGASVVIAQEKSDRISTRDKIVVGPDETRNNVVAFGSDIVIDGKVLKTVFALGGSITVSGEVGDGVIGIGAAITLKSTAVVRGDLVGLGGTIAKEAGAKVEGDTVSVKPSELTGKIFRGGFKGIFAFSFWPIILIIKLVNLFIWFLVVLVVASLFPRQITFAADEVRRNFWPVFGTGLLALIGFIVFIIFSAILCLVLIGIPILFGLALVGLVVKIFGRVALLFFFGESLARALNKPRVSPIAGALLGLLVVGLIGFVPFFGFLFSFLLSALGWGVALRTKFGTTENWFRRGLRPAAPIPPAPPAG